MPLAFILPLKLLLSTLPSWIFIDLNCSSDKTTSFDCFSITEAVSFFSDEVEQETMMREKQKKRIFDKIFIELVFNIYLKDILE